LESRTKDYRLSMVIGSRTAERAQGRFATMEIDLIQVKGKKQPEAVFTVIGRAEVASDPRGRELCDFNARKLANGFDVAGLYDMYVERIAAYRADPPGADWNGVYEAESK